MIRFSVFILEVLPLAIIGLITAGAEVAIWSHPEIATSGALVLSGIVGLLLGCALSLLVEACDG